MECVSKAEIKKKKKLSDVRKGVWNKSGTGKGEG